MERPAETRSHEGATGSIEWRISDAPVDYAFAVQEMEARAQAIAEGRAREMVWLLEHPPIYTAGTSAKAPDLLTPERFPVYATGRGGQYTYHGPGQRVVYVMLDVKARVGRTDSEGRRVADVRGFVTALEGWIIDTLATFNVRGETRPDRVGVWVKRPEKGEGREDKVAAIGIRLKRWVSLHGLAINVEPELEHFAGIVPCGISAHGVTSLVDLGLPVTMADVDVALKRTFDARFGATDQD